MINIEQHKGIIIYRLPNTHGDFSWFLKSFLLSFTINYFLIQLTRGQGIFWSLCKSKVHAIHTLIAFGKLLTSTKKLFFFFLLHSHHNVLLFSNICRHILYSVHHFFLVLLSLENLIFAFPKLQIIDFNILKMPCHQPWYSSRQSLYCEIRNIIRI